jgi:hypothetical protein
VISKTRRGIKFEGNAEKQEDSLFDSTPWLISFVSMIRVPFSSLTKTTTKKIKISTPVNVA